MTIAAQDLHALFEPIRARDGSWWPTKLTYMDFGGTCPKQSTVTGRIATGWWWGTCDELPT